MVAFWFRNGEECAAAACLFQNSDPDNRLPHTRTVKNAIERFFELGNVEERKRPGRPKVETSPEKTIDTVASVVIAPKLSLRDQALQACSSKDSVHRILKEQKILQPGDPERRLLFNN